MKNNKEIGGKRRIGVVKLLAWAWREELPLAKPLRAASGIGGPSPPRSAWLGMAMDAIGPTVSDGRPMLNGWGVAADLSAKREPHPDALLVGQAVMALDALVFDLPPDWAAKPEVRAAIAVRGDADDLTEAEWQAAAQRAINRLTVTEADGSLRPRHKVSDIVIGAATRGRAPQLRKAIVTRQPVLAANGRAAWFVREWREIGTEADGSPRFADVETNGVQKNGKLKPGAYRRFIDTPDPADFMVERAEYEVWRAAMDVLAEDLAGRLARFEVTGCKLPFLPWIEAGFEGGAMLAEDGGGRIVPSLAPAAPAPKVKPLVLAGPPLSEWGTPVKPRRPAARGENKCKGSTPGKKAPNAGLALFNRLIRQAISGRD